MPRKQSDLNNAGQSLIETVAALFILVTTLFVALGLAVQNSRTNDNANKQILGTALAREGVEAIKNIRDTNWLRGVLEDCADIMGAGQSCYRNWLRMPDGSGSIIGSEDGINYVLQLDKDDPERGWELVADESFSSYALAKDAEGYFTVDCTSNCSGFYRAISVYHDFDYGGLRPSNPVRVFVISTVWWQNQKCPRTEDPASLPSGCKVVLEQWLTNWRNF